MNPPLITYTRPRRKPVIQPISNNSWWAGLTNQVDEPMVSDKAIREFQELHKQRFGSQLPTGRASTDARQLLHLVWLMYQSILKEPTEENGEDGLL